MPKCIAANLDEGRGEVDELQRLAAVECPLSNFEEPFREDHLLQMFAVFKHTIWQDVDGGVDEDVRRIPRHRDARRVDEKWRGGRVLPAPIIGHGANGGAVAMPRRMDDVVVGRGRARIFEQKTAGAGWWAPPDKARVESLYYRE